MRVYVAGPYSKGHVNENVRAAVAAGERLVKAGHIPYIPHLHHFWDLLYPGPQEQWMKFDLEWLHQCEVVLRLPGYSAGADLEVATADQLGIPVFYNVWELAPGSENAVPEKKPHLERAEACWCNTP